MEMEMEMEMEGGSGGMEEEVRVWSWGAGTDGQLGTGSLQDGHVPQPLLLNFPSTAVRRISHMACGGAHAIALTGDGKVLTWGRDTHGQLGHGKLENCLQPTLVKFLEDYTVYYVSAGWNHSGFVTDCGRLFMCGNGSFGQLGNGDNKSYASPIAVTLFQSRHVEQIACGMRHSIVLLRGPPGDSVFGFGSGRHGQVGLSVCGSVRFNNLPKAIHGFDNSKIVHICANGDHSAALSDNGQLYTWGRGFSGNLDAYSPRIWPSSLRFSQLALGWNHALVLAEDEIYMLGGKHHGNLSSSQQNNLGQGALTTADPCSTSGGATLQRVLGLDEEKVVSISAGAEHSALVTEKGRIMTWGWGEHGQLGLGDTEDWARPQTVNLHGERSTDGDRFRVYCGSGFTFAVKSSC